MDGIELEIDITKSLIKQILKKPLYINDMEDIDPEETRSLLWLV